MKPRQNLALIGSGPSAIFLLKHLLDGIEKSQCWLDSISIFEKSGTTGVGMPYSPRTTDRYHLSNISSEEIPALTVSFADWLRSQPDAVLEPLHMTGVEIDEKSIYSRLALGCYLRVQYRSMLGSLADHGIRIEEHPARAVSDVRDIPGENQVELVTCGGDRLRFDKAVIATGHSWPEEDAPDAGYYASPWPIAKIIPPRGAFLNHAVGTLGASLSACDVISSLAHRHGRFLKTPEGVNFTPHHGAGNFKVVMYSAEGLLPHLQYEQAEAMREIYRHVDRESLLALVDAEGFLRLDAYFDAVCRPVLIRAFENDGLEEVSRLLAQPRFGWHELVEEMTSRHTYADAFEGMRSEFEEASDSVRDRRPIHWKESLDDLMYTLNFHAELLPAEDHLRLHSSVLPFLMNIVAALPLESAEMLLALHSAGKLELAEGKVVGVDKDTAQGTTSVELDGPAKHPRPVYRTFVDCSGQSPLLELTEYPFPGLVHEKAVRPARVPFANPAKPSKALTKDEQSRVFEESGRTFFGLGGIEVNPAGRIVGDDGVPNPRIFDIAFPHASGVRPYSYGLQACNETASILAKALTSEAAASDRRDGAN